MLTQTQPTPITLAELVSSKNGRERKGNGPLFVDVKIGGVNVLRRRRREKHNQ